MGEVVWTRIIQSSNWSLLGLLGRSGVVFSWESGEGSDPLQQAGYSNPPSLHPPGMPWGTQGHRPPIRNTQKYSHLPQQQPDGKKKKKKKKNKADKAQPSERQSVLFLIQYSYLISALAFQFPDYPA